MEHKRAGASFEKSASSNAGGAYKLPEARKKHKSRKLRNRITAYVIAGVLVVISAWLLFDKLFIVRNFEISGDSEYTKEQAFKAAESIGIFPGDHIFGFDKKTAVMNAKYQLPMFDSVDIAFEMPDTVVLKVKEAVPCMYTVFGNNGYVLSEGLRIVAAHSDTSECEELGLARVDFGAITKCIAGEFLETDGDSGEIVKQLYAVLKEEGVAPDVTAIDVSDKFDISFEYKKRFEVKLGDDKGLTVKIRYMQAIVRELEDSDSGVIDVSDEKHRDATFKPYNKM